MPQQGDERLDRLLTVPNVFTAIRICCIPVFVWLLVRHHRSGWFDAAILLAVLGVTDGVDGFLARRLGQVSTLGKVLDPVADRLLLAVAAISIIVVGAVPLWVAAIALVREAVVATGFLVVAALGGRRMDVQIAGKAATFGLMAAMPLFLTGHSTVGFHRVAEILAWVAVIPALILGWYAAVTYFPKARHAVHEGRAERAGRA